LQKNDSQKFKTKKRLYTIAKQNIKDKMNRTIESKPLKLKQLKRKLRSKSLILELNLETKLSQIKELHNRKEDNLSSLLSELEMDIESLQEEYKLNQNLLFAILATQALYLSKLAKNENRSKSLKARADLMFNITEKIYYDKIL
jgi:hypothetical protein